MRLGFESPVWGIRDRAEQAGHEPADLELVCLGPVMLHGHDQGDQRGPLQGARDEILADIAKYEQTKHPGRVVTVHA